MTKKQLFAGMLAAGVLISGIPCQNVQAAEKEKPAALTQEMVDEANNEYNNNDGVQVEFVSMSDTHIASYESKKWAFENIEEWSEQIGFDTDTVMVDGDIEANEREETPGNSVRFYTDVATLMEETFGDLPIQFATGNHDIQKNMEQVFDEKGKEEVWHYKSKTGSTYNNYHVNINGIDFITLDYRSGATYKKFLEDTLSEIKGKEDYDPAKPVFVQIHTGVSGTTAGSYQDCANTRTYLQNTLADWPQAVVMTAHSHYSAEVEDGIYQKNFTVVNNGSMDYVEVDKSKTVENEVANWVQGNMEDKHYELTCNYVTVMEDGTTVIRRFDVTNKRWMGMPWKIDTKEGKEGFQYTTEKRSKIAPWFEDDAKILVDNIGDTTADLTFDQAVDEQLTEYYRVTVRDFLTNKDVSFKVLPENYDYAGDESYKVPKEFTGSFDAYSRYYLRPYPEQMKFYLSGLQPNTRYRIMVQAFDSFDNGSLIKDVVFKTTGETEELPNTLPDTIEDSKFLDMDFNEESLKDSEEQISAQSSGDVSYEEGIEGKAARVPAGDSSYIDLGKDSRMNGEENLTINFWIRSYSTRSDATVISNKNWSNGKNPGWYMGYRLSDLSSIGINMADGNNRVDFDGFTALGNTWKMVTAVFDQSADKAYIYLDGKQSTVEDISSITGSVATDFSVRIGTDGAGKNGGADFAIDDLQMWNRVLTDEEILAIYGTMIYEEDTTDYAEKLAELIKEAEVLLAEYQEGVEGVFYQEETALRLTECVEEAKKAQTKEEQQYFCGEVSYLIEKMRNEREWVTINKTGFDIEACDSWHGDHGEGDYGTSRAYAPENAIDGNNETAWHTSWTTGEDGTALYKFPHSIIIDMQESYAVSGLERLGRSNRDYIKDFTVEMSDDLEALENETEFSSDIGVSGTLEDTEDAFYSFGKTLRGRYVKVTILNTWLMEDEGSEGKQWAYTAELNFTGHKVSEEKTITASVEGNGSISPEQMTVLAGDDAVFMLVPEEGNKVKTVTVNGASGAAVFTLENNTLTIPDVQEDLALNVVFEEVQTAADPVDKTQLKQAITDAKYILAHKEFYQKETLEGLEEALGYAETVAENTEAVQEEVDQAVQQLEKEIQEVRPAEDTGAQGGGNNGDENTNPENPSQNKTEQAAKTGDERNLLIPGAGAVLSLVVLLMAAVRKRYR